MADDTAGAFVAAAAQPATPLWRRIADFPLVSLVLALIALLVLAFVANYFLRVYWKENGEFYDRGIVMHYLLGGFPKPETQ